MNKIRIFRSNTELAHAERYAYLNFSEGAFYRIKDYVDELIQQAAWDAAKAARGEGDNHACR